MDSTPRVLCPVVLVLQRSVSATNDPKDSMNQFVVCAETFGCQKLCELLDVIRSSDRTLAQEEIEAILCMWPNRVFGSLNLDVAAALRLQLESSMAFWSRDTAYGTARSQILDCGNRIKLLLSASLFRLTLTAMCVVFCNRCRVYRTTREEKAA